MTTTFNKRFEVYVGKLDGDDEGYIAICKNNPSFCLYGKSEKEVRAATEEALSFYAASLLGKKEKKPTIKLGNPKSLDLNEVYRFRPTEVFTAEAC